jgi:hypothetical protein
VQQLLAEGKEPEIDPRLVELARKTSIPKRSPAP